MRHRGRTAAPVCFSLQGSDSPVTLLVQVSATLRAVLLVALRLVEAVGGALTHLGVLQGGKDQSHVTFQGGAG